MKHIGSRRRASTDRAGPVAAPSTQDSIHRCAEALDSRGRRNLCLQRTLANEEWAQKQ